MHSVHKITFLQEFGVMFATSYSIRTVLINYSVTVYVFNCDCALKHIGRLAKVAAGLRL